ncbi:kelch-like [Seminavis robusta]|uniref:Kelch-like n=1 Tax=Seminavis robusta TaxID=568900 RepID=A0A9N8EP29_9STRA|nr:kelch-like [Seminavis robusta]|eukprot:Sro1267_g257660.1 kelch-like (354) ;mRNA; r:14207-15268
MASSTTAAPTRAAASLQQQQQQQNAEEERLALLSLLNDVVSHLPNNREEAVKMIIPWLGMLVWPLIVSLPLLLSSSWSPISYQDLFPAEWYEYNPMNPSERPKPLGLFLGFVAVAIGNAFVIGFAYLYKFGYLSAVRGQEPPLIQRRLLANDYEFMEAVKAHLFQPEGFVLLGIYLASMWMFKLMPNSYYSFEGGIQWRETFLCLVLQDGFQFIMHRLEHALSPRLYQLSHKPHHRFINPKMFDAFNGSLADTILMILTPLYLTSNVMRTCNVWTYMAFGSTYSCWLTMLHSEYVLPWDGLFKRLGFGTPADHHVHHSIFKYNYGHLFMWFDIVAGTYRDPRDLAPKLFNPHV